MATKNNPGKFDCYANAEADEPMFVLLGRDLLAQHLTKAWAALRSGDALAAVHAIMEADKQLRASGKEPLPPSSEKIVEARMCARAMQDWLDKLRYQAWQAYNGTS